MLYLSSKVVFILASSASTVESLLAVIFAYAFTFQTCIAIASDPILQPQRVDESLPYWKIPQYVSILLSNKNGVLKLKKGLKINVFISFGCHKLLFKEKFWCVQRRSLTFGWANSLQTCFPRWGYALVSLAAICAAALPSTKNFAKSTISDTPIYFNVLK